MTTIRQRIVEIVREAGPAGMMAADIGKIIGGHQNSCRASINKVSCQGLLIPVGPKCRTRYFVEQAFADAHTQQLPVILAAIKDGVNARRRARARSRYEQRADAANPSRKRPAPRKPRLQKNDPLYVTLKPAHKHKPPNITQIVVPENVKRTVHPTPPGRFEVPASFVGVFRAAGVGRDMNGAAW